MLIFASIVSAYDLQEYYPLNENNNWTYLSMITGEGKSDFSKRTIQVTSKEMVGDAETAKLIYSDDENECLAVDSEGAKRYKFFSEDSYEIFKPSLMLYPNNLQVGESKEYSFSSEHIRHKINTPEDIENKDEREGTMNVTLEAIEDIKVPAGQFSECLRFSSVFKWKGKETEDFAEERYTTWLAKNVGTVKEVCDVAEYDQDSAGEEKFTESFELISATVNGNSFGLSQ